MLYTEMSLHLLKLSQESFFVNTTFNIAIDVLFHPLKETDPLAVYLPLIPAT